jgi:spore coat protein U-like protein
MKSSKIVLSKLTAAVLGCLVLGFAAVPATAGTATATFAVSATVQATCAVATTPMAFGNYSSITAAPGTSTVTVTCTTGTPYTLGLDAGLGSLATVTARKMMNGAVVLNYGLYTDAAHTTNFATLASANGTGAGVPVTVYGLVPANQFVAPNAYSDTITATVTY